MAVTKCTPQVSITAYSIQIIDVGDCYEFKESIIRVFERLCHPENNTFENEDVAVPLRYYFVADFMHCEVEYEGNGKFKFSKYQKDANVKKTFCNEGKYFKIYYNTIFVFIVRTHVRNTTKITKQSFNTDSPVSIDPNLGPANWKRTCCDLLYVI